MGKWHLGLNLHVWGDMEHGPLGTYSHSCCCSRRIKYEKVFNTQNKNFIIFFVLGQGFDYFFGLVHTLVDGFELEHETFFSARHALSQGKHLIVSFFISINCRLYCSRFFLCHSSVPCAVLAVLEKKGSGCGKNVYFTLFFSSVAEPKLFNFDTGSGCTFFLILAPAPIPALF